METMQTEPLCNFDNGDLLQQRDNNDELNKECNQKRTFPEHENEVNEEPDLSGLIENESFGSCNSLNHSENSDVWKGSDSEDEIDQNDGHKSNIVTENVEKTPESTTNSITNNNNNNNNKTDETKAIDNGDECEQTKNENEIEKSSDKHKESEESPKETTAGSEDVEVENKGDKTEKAEQDKSNAETEGDKEKNAEQDKSNAETEGVEEKNAEQGMDKSKDEKAHVDNNNDDEVADIDESLEDLDPSLDPSLLLSISMDVEESPVITNVEPAPLADGSTSPLLYDPVFSTYVDEVTGAEISFNLTPEELELRKEIYGDGRTPIKMTRLHCTACNVHLGSALQGQTNRFVHPLLKVLICKECYHFYTSGEFDKDEDGSELYCRWCGQGGQVLCCSKCEFVFCKKCIRNNFGRRKLAQIRDSDEWSCFRCNPIQLQNLRVACMEFFEYVRQEVSRASTLNDPTFWSTDYSTCCHPGDKGGLTESAEGKAAESKKSRKKAAKDLDPDFDPTLENVPEKKRKELSPVIKPIQFLPQFGLAQKNNEINKTFNNLPTVTVATTTTTSTTTATKSIFRPILPNTLTGTVVRLGGTPFSVPRPRVQTVSKQIIRPVNLTAGVRTATVQAARSQNITPTSNAHFTQHEWFEKTVVSAAKINSHLSFTLSQLNKQQAQATTVEDLAVVHNKLQEILSNSINSLIQVRKNLRTDFISGIKNVKFPPKLRTIAPQPQQPTAILISKQATVIPTPITTLQPLTTRTVPQTKAAMKTVSGFTMNDDDVIFITPNRSNVFANSPTPGTSRDDADEDGGAGNGDPPRLKVRSFNDLQNVPSDCIIIPDDPAEKTDNSNKNEDQNKETLDKVKDNVDKEENENKEQDEGDKEDNENKEEGKGDKEDNKNKEEDEGDKEGNKNKQEDKGDKEGNENKQEDEGDKENENKEEDKGDNKENETKKKEENRNENSKKESKNEESKNEEVVTEENRKREEERETVQKENEKTIEKENENSNKEISNEIKNGEQYNEPSIKNKENSELKEKTDEPASTNLENKENKVEEIKKRENFLKRDRSDGEISDDGGPKAKRRKRRNDSTSSTSSSRSTFTYNVKDLPPAELQRMTSVKVCLHKLNNLSIKNGL